MNIKEFRRIGKYLMTYLAASLTYSEERYFLSIFIFGSGALSGLMLDLGLLEMI